MRLEQQLGISRIFGIQMYFSPFDDQFMGGGPKITPLRFESGPRGLKILDSSESPLIRLDYPQHGKNPPFHIQYGGEEKNGCNPERSGEEAVDLFSQVLLNTKRSWSLWEDNEEDENKD
jgi:hypothetical protein